MRTGYLFRALLLASSVVLAFGGCRKEGEHARVVDISTAPLDQAPIVSGKNTKVYHLRACRYARDIPDKELLGFASRAEAAGTRRFGCAHCRPDEQSRAVLVEVPEERPAPSETRQE